MSPLPFKLFSAVHFEDRSELILDLVAAPTLSPVLEESRCSAVSAEALFQRVGLAIGAENQFHFGVSGMYAGPQGSVIPAVALGTKEKSR